MSDATNERTRSIGRPRDVVLLSLLVLALTFVIARYGVGSPVGLVAVAAQMGLLIRINLVYRRSGGSAET